MNRSREKQSGAALIEAIISLVFFIIPLLFGIIEFTAYAIDNYAAQGIVRTVSRLEGSLGSKPAVDFYALQAARAGQSNFLTSEITRIEISDATAPADCSRDCNRYENLNPSMTDFAAGPCTVANVDNGFCPANRDNTYADGLGSVRISITFRHRSVTGIGFTNRTYTQSMIVQLDPDTREA